nr:uncharacterized protein LOC112697375 isoform X2 [Arachis hypogaea]
MHVFASTSTSKVQKSKLPQIKLGILQARYPLVDSLSLHHRLRLTPPLAATIAYPLSLPSSLSSISPFLRSCVRHSCSWSHPLSASSSTDKQPPAAATFCATATSPPPHCLSVLLPPFINAESLKTATKGRKESDNRLLNPCVRISIPVTHRWINLVIN